MLITAGVIGVIFLLERHDIVSGRTSTPSYGRNSLMLALWFLWALWQGRMSVRQGRFSELDRRSWIVFTSLIVVFGVTTIVADARDFATPDALALFWLAGLSVALLVVGLQANRALTAGGIALFGCCIAGIVFRADFYRYAAAGILIGLVGPGIVLTLGGSAARRQGH